MKQTLAQSNNLIAQNPLTDPVVCQSPVSVGKRIFSDKELVEMFPEAKSTIKELIKEDERTIEGHRELLNVIKSDLSSRVSIMDVDTASMLVFTVVRKDYIIHNSPKDQPDNGFYILEMAQDRLDRNKRLLACYGYDKTKNEDFENRLARARVFSIENLVKLNRSGKACCPLHDEKTPSFSVNRKKNVWCCFGACGRGGDVIDLFMEMNGCGFKEAVNKLS